MAHPELSMERFAELFADVLLTDPDLIRPSALLVEELGVQSIDVVYLTERIEEELGLDLDGLDLGDVETVEELYWELLAGGDDGGESVVSERALHASELAGLPHEVALRAWLPSDPLADVTTLVGMVMRRAALSPDRVAFTFDGQDTTYRDLARQVARMAAALRGSGVGPRDRVVLVMPNSAEFFAVFYGVQHLRAVAVPLYHVPQPDRIARIAHHCGARAVVTLRPLARPVRRRLEAALGEDGPALLDVPSLSSEPVVPGTLLPQPEPDDLAMLQYTSGTTGDAKGVMLTHRALMANIRQAVPLARFTRDDVFVSWLPVYHDMGLITMTMCPFYLGAHLVLLPVRLKADTWLSAIQAHRGTVTAAPDFAYRFVLRTGGDLSRFDVDSLRVALVAAEPVRARTIARFEAELGIPGVLRPGYGLAEASVAVTFYPLDRPNLKVDAHGMVCAGQPVAGAELSIRDDAGRRLPPGEVGEICLRSPSQTLGYYAHHEATIALFTPDGSVRTGDLGYLDDEGMLTIVDRKKNIVIVGGRNLSPREVEEVVDRIPEVSLSMAVGVDEGGDAGEQVQVVVETAEPTADPSSADRSSADPPLARVLGRAVRLAVQEAMGLRVQKVHVVPRGTIPRTYNGKLQYTTMRQRIRDTGGALTDAP